MNIDDHTNAPHIETSIELLASKHFRSYNEFDFDVLNIYDVSIIDVSNPDMPAFLQLIFWNSSHQWFLQSQSRIVSPEFLYNFMDLIEFYIEKIDNSIILPAESHCPIAKGCFPVSGHSAQYFASGGISALGVSGD